MDPLGFTPFRREGILQRRGIRQTFSSWDRCMASAYCKWPAIVAIIIGGLIIITVLWAVLACVCCGYTCCKGCCACCSCCCPSSGSKSKARDHYSNEQTAYNNQYPSGGYQHPPAPPVYSFHRPSPKQYAQFDVTHSHTQTNGDALPEMPMWEPAPTRRVEDTSQPYDLEMNTLDPVTGQNVSRPMRGNNNSNPNSPAYTSAFDGYCAPEPTNYHPGNIARTPSPGDPVAADDIGIATSYPNSNQQQTLYPNRNANPNLSPHSSTSTYPPSNDAPITTHSTTSRPSINTYDFPRRYPPSPVPHSPTAARSYSPYPPPQQPLPQLHNLQQQQQPSQQGYRAYSPSVPNTPPPPFSSTLGDYDQILPGAQHGQYGASADDEGPPPSLQVGRVPVSNSWREV
ncbi:uncharacterized protein PADG_03674 [Paracoccidioides brasiliensis Pb18]|uniref:Uncharacterized protein n=1 Tax=Paracoccidioides brasiliensis (strain Pb18) TaxID=502780 RepID=C1G8T8_PARBD|nr:uncharacterized protein PADG_03674 [Paracoccidioides brasiliensis Pb18]EEH47590.2 hypothetical protein PADG_03674 [Paracoccidioides brasiliensis Pb18]